MKTTIDIPENMLRDAMRHTKLKTKKEVVLKALNEMNRLHHVEALLKYAGTSDTFMTNEQIEALDMSRTARFRR